MGLATSVRISLIVLAVTVSLSLGEEPYRPLRFHPERLLVRFVPGTSKAVRDAAHNSLGATELREYKSFDGLVLVKVPEGEVLQKRAAFEARGDVLRAQPDIEFDFFGTTPSDCEFENQWALFNEATGFDIDAKDAWDLVRGDRAVRIAVIDDGVDYTHPDLKSKIWFNPEEDIDSPGEHELTGDPLPCPDPGTWASARIERNAACQSRIAQTCRTASSFVAPTLALHRRRVAPLLMATSTAAIMIRTGTSTISWGMTAATLMAIPSHCRDTVTARSQRGPSQPPQTT